MSKIILAAAYLASVAAAAYAITHVGEQPFPGGPHTLPVWPGIAAPSGVYVVGLTLVIRDLLQRMGIRKVTMIGLILVGAVLSAIFSPAVAVASCVAFALSESVDYGVFTIAEPRVGTYAAIGLSNAVSLVVDSVTFLAIAFGSLAYVEGQIIGKTWATLAAIAALWVARRVRQVVPA
jgi:uncharacterized PurR-regulated membrane protein YhhQ (DUF165 family)